MSKIIVKNCKRKDVGNKIICNEQMCPFWYDDSNASNFCSISEQSSYGCEITIEVKPKEQNKFKVEVNND
jgi:hypothetical protein